MPELLDRLRDHCRARPGMTSSNPNQFALLGGFLDHFAGFYPSESPPVALLRVSNRDRTALAKKYPGVRKSDKMRWKTKGWVWTDVPIDGTVPEVVLLQMIDRSYQIVVDGSNDDTRLRIELIGRNLSPRALLAELIDRYDLGSKRRAIGAIVEPALLLRTNKTKEAGLPVGQSKIGGRPDLPEGVPWPRHSSCKPLAFLAQINLADAAKAVAFSGLPKAGVLHVFSVYGWQVEGNWDPQLPPGQPADDWTRILYHPSADGLKRQKTPPKVNAFPAAAVEFVPVLSLPADSHEPARAALNLSDDEQNRFDSLYDTFEAVTMYPLASPPRHQLLGYAKYEQQFVDAVAEQKLRLVFQLASDGNVGMWWGDDGFLYYWASPADLKKRDFSRVVTDYQCG